ncbi:MAG: hypothetical protein EZS28_002439 [Streblomastix strix]|uniref:Uncharacterized protein n=1 Tax=Streblomastix strix TaxID=222440 RepID=A0A5J4X3X7_9EUKA|nr:MAG: hypothetical protein EZS28_002439 [Streblomastix strix]
MWRFCNSKFGWITPVLADKDRPLSEIDDKAKDLELRNGGGVRIGPDFEIGGYCWRCYQDSKDASYNNYSGLVYIFYRRALLIPVLSGGLLYVGL